MPPHPTAPAAAQKELWLNYRPAINLVQTAMGTAARIVRFM